MSLFPGTVNGPGDRADTLHIRSAPAPFCGFTPQMAGGLSLGCRAALKPVGAGTGCEGGWLDLEGALRVGVEGAGGGLRFRGHLCQEARDADLPGTG